MSTYVPHPTDAHALELVNLGALFVVNHSGGKDSQALLLKVRALVPAAQILVVHAHLPGVEWEGTEEHARATSEGLAFRTCQAGKTFLGMVEKRGKFPGPKHRQCTSDLKRGPIERTIREYLRETGREGSVVVNAMGMRAEESGPRSKLEPWKEDPGMATERGAVRRWFDWLPVHRYALADVWRVIEAAGQRPHWAYAAGMSRLSCSFCIMSSKADLVTAARLRPELYARLCELEEQIGHTMFSKGKKGIPLEQHTGVPRRRLEVLP